MCDYCVSQGALSQDTYNKIENFLDKYPFTEFGPAHIVLSDCNVGDGHIKWCLGLARAALSKNPGDLTDLPDDIELMNKLDWYSDDDPEDIEATIVFLEELLQTPKDIR